jgi:hypothetical protein
MNTPFSPLYNIADGDVRMLHVCKEHRETIVSVELITDAAFDGTTTTARLLQSNDLELDLADWQHLPEAPLVLITGAGGSLLQTISFTCKYLAIEILQGDATAGTIKLIAQYNG